MRGMREAVSAWEMIGQMATRFGADRQRSALETEVSALFAELREPLLRYLHTLGLSFEDGEDIAQEVFLSLFHHLREGKPRDHLRGWIFRVGHNLALKRRWQNARLPESVAGRVAELICVDPGPNPEEHAAASQSMRRLDAVVQALPEQDRCCLFLRAEGLRYREIAAALEMSLGGVAASLNRSLAKMACAGPGSLAGGTR